MKLRIDDGEHDVSVGPTDAEGKRRATVDGREYLIETLGTRDGEWRLSVDGRRVTLRAAPSADGTWVAWSGRTRLVVGALSGLKTENRKPRTSLPGGRSAQAVTPTFPSVVVAVLVEIGDEVRRGQELVVVSAMKMESRLTAPRAGTVRAIRASVGASVRPGDELVEIEPATGESGDG